MLKLSLVGVRQEPLNRSCNSGRIFYRRFANRVLRRIGLMLAVFFMGLVECFALPVAHGPEQGVFINLADRAATQQTLSDPLLDLNPAFLPVATKGESVLDPQANATSNNSQNRVAVCDDEFKKFRDWQNILNPILAFCVSFLMFGWYEEWRR